jgi:hypothetical protein
MPSLPRSLGLVPAIFNKVWTMNSIAFCYLHPCYVCCGANDRRRNGRRQIEKPKIILSVGGKRAAAQRAR